MITHFLFMDSTRGRPSKGALVFYGLRYPVTMNHLSPASWLLSGILLLLNPLCGCRTLDTPGFERVQIGMDQSQVREILGEPSSTYDRQIGTDGVLVRFERWQYGDTPSTLATGMVFSDLPSDEVWAVFFDEDGVVIKLQSPMARHSGPRPVEFPDMIPSRSR
ncbi:MAG: hypothetical protein CMJ33_05870 [Phycisphaerae bacterium]|nr:hypothetical protein [Phycisphaerae bacterium]